MLCQGHWPFCVRADVLGQAALELDLTVSGLSYTTYYIRIVFLLTRAGPIRHHSHAGTVSWPFINLVIFFSEVQLYVQIFARYYG